MVIADFISQLPLHVEEFRDDKSWGDTWDYDYSRPSEDTFKVEIPATTEVFDLKKERAELLKFLSTGVVFLKRRRTAQVLFPGAEKRVSPVLPVKVSGSVERLQGNMALNPGLGAPKPNHFEINGKHRELATLVRWPGRDFKSFKPFQSERASLKIGDHQLTNVPVFHVCEAWTLLRPLMRQ